MATLLFSNARILTMDEHRPYAEALVVRGDKIAFAGPVAEAGRLAGPEAERVDLRGGTLVPGFNDNHVHAIILGDHELAPNLGGLDEGAVVALLRERWRDAPPGRVLYAFNWDYPACPEPRKELLDEAFPRNPVILSQFSGHAQWLNSAALAALGIWKGSPDPASGQVLRDPDGEPTGIVRDLGDTGLSRRRFARIFLDRRQREERLDLALATFRRLGITSVQDNLWFPQALGSYSSYLARGRLTARFSVWPLGRQPWTVVGMRIATTLARSLGVLPRNWVSFGPAKFFIDGAFSTRTACLCEPWADEVAEPGPSGPPLEGLPGGPPAPRREPRLHGLCGDSRALVRQLEYLARARLRGAYHAIGDGAVKTFLDAFEKAAARHPSLVARRFRIEHAQLVRPEDLGRLRDLGVLVAAQPSALSDPEKDRRLLGPERALRAYPYRSLLDSGVKLSFGSDIPGESTCDPLLGIHRAVNREGPEAIGPMEALRAYTRGSAYAEFAESRKGMLAPGMLADFALLSADPASCDPAAIRDIKVLQTWVGGRKVYDASE